MVENPKVSIVTISYNAASEIEATMRSVLEQSYQNIEYLVIDGASKDGTPFIARRIAAEYPKRKTIIISEKDKGLYDAMNKGIRTATGKWCAFMNCGDRYDNNEVVASVFRNLHKLDEAKVIYGKTVLLHEDGTSSLYSTASITTLPRIIQKYHPFCHQSAFYNIENKDDCIYDTRYRIGADYDVCCRYFKKYGVESFSFADLVIADYKAFEGVSSNKKLLQYEHILVKIRNGMSILEITRNIISYIMKRY